MAAEEEESVTLVCHPPHGLLRHSPVIVSMATGEAEGRGGDWKGEGRDTEENLGRGRAHCCLLMMARSQRCDLGCGQVRRMLATLG